MNTRRWYDNWYMGLVGGILLADIFWTIGLTPGKPGVVAYALDLAGAVAEADGRGDAPAAAPAVGLADGPGEGLGGADADAGGVRSRTSHAGQRAGHVRDLCRADMEGPPVKRSLRFKVNLMECPSCRGAHAHWWFTSKVAPLSCAERQKRNA
jgi:hypothetical protein